MNAGVSSRRAKTGFTLIELVVVVTIIGIMAAAVVPVFRGALAGAREEQAMRDFYALLQQTQARAIMDAREYRVYVHTKERRFRVARLEYGDKGETIVDADTRGMEGLRYPETLQLRNPRARTGGRKDAFFVAVYPSGAWDQTEWVFRDRSESRREFRFVSAGTRIKREWPE